MTRTPSGWAVPTPATATRDTPTAVTTSRASATASRAGEVSLNYVGFPWNIFMVGDLMKSLKNIKP